MTEGQSSSISRRNYLQAVGTTATAIAVLDSVQSGTNAQTDTEDWPQFGYGPANTNHAPANTGPVASIDRLWRFEDSSPEGSAPVLVDDTLYVGVGDDMAALSTADGSRRWRARYKEDVISTPAVADSRVYFGAEKKLYAYDITTQSRDWLVNIRDRITEAPTVVDETVFIGTTNGDMYAVDAATGNELWSENVGFGTAITTAATVANGNVYYGTTDERLISLAADDGTKQWTLRIDGELQAAPTVTDGTIYAATTSGHIYGIVSRNGEPWLSLDLDKTITSELALADGILYFGTADGQVSAVSVSLAADAETYEESTAWTFQTDGPVGSPVVVDETVYVGSEDGHVYALDAADGTLHWSYDTGGAVTDAPAVTDRKVYVRSANRGVFGLDRSITANIAFSPENPITQETVTFDAAGSTPTEIITSYEWTINGETFTGQTAEYTFDREETFEVELTVSDGEGHVDSTTKLVPIAAQPPTAAFRYSPDPPVPGEPVTFNGSPSTDPDGPITEYNWLIGNIETAEGESVEYTFSSPGRYYVELTVRDTDGETDTTQQSVTVTEPNSTTTTTPGDTTTTPGDTTTTPGDTTTIPGDTTTTPGDTTTTPGDTTTTPGDTTTTPGDTTTTPGDVDTAGGTGGNPPDSGSNPAYPWAQLGVGAVAGLTGLAGWLHFDMAKRMRSESAGVTAATTDGGQALSTEVSPDEADDDSGETANTTSTDEPSDTTDEHNS